LEATPTRCTALVDGATAARGAFRALGRVAAIGRRIGAASHVDRAVVEAIVPALHGQCGDNDANKVAVAARWAESAVDQVGPRFRIIKVEIADAISDAALTSSTSCD